MQSQSTSTPASGIVFSLTTTGQWDGTQINKAARNIGLTYDGPAVVLASRDTGEPLAVLRYNGYRSAVGELQRIDIELCTAIEPDMGGRLVATLEALRDELDDCVICDADGVPMTLPELQAAADAMDATTAHRIEASRPKPQRQPDGTMRVPGHLSFMHTTTTTRGKWIDDCHFQSEPMGYYEGRREGFRRAAELMAFIKGHKTREVPTDKIMAAAFGGKTPWLTHDDSADNVAGGFIEMMMAMIRGAARHIDHESHIERVIAQSLKDEKSMADFERDRHQKIGMKAAATRKAKRDAKAIALMSKGIGMSMIAPFEVWADGVVIATHATEEEADECYARIRQQRIDAKKAVAA